MAVLHSWQYFLKVFLLVIFFGIYGLWLYAVRIITVGPRAFFYYKKRNNRPPILNGTTYGEHVFIRLKQARVKLHCIINGPKDGQLMLFLHGFPEFWYSWRHQILEFSKTYRTVAIDMRGYAESDKPLGVENYELSRLSEDIDELITLLGYTSCILVGHDWGGVVAWKLVADHPDKVDKMVIGNMPHPLAFEEHINSSFSQLKKSWYIFFFQLPVLPVYFLLLQDLGFLEAIYTHKVYGAGEGTFTDEDIECFKYTFADYGDICSPMNYYRASMRYKTKIIGFEKKINKPVLLIWGTADNYLDTEMAELSTKHVENIKVKYIEGTSHWVQQESPVEFNSYMKEFLSK